MAIKIGLLKALLRILTPEEINDLTTSSNSEDKVPLSAVLDDICYGRRLHIADELIGQEASESDDTNSGAPKILPFNNSEPVGHEHCKYPRELAYVQAGPRVYKLILEGMRDASNIFKSAKDLKYVRPYSDEDEKGTIFILREKLKMQNSQRRLKEKEVLSLYEKNANINIEQEKINRDDMTKSTQYGVLINKKQA